MAKWIRYYVSDDIFLGILLDGGVEPKLADEICWIHKLSLSVLHHGEESLQAGHLAPGLVQLRVLKLIGSGTLETKDPQS
jgi:hypothetical protein